MKLPALVLALCIVSVGVPANAQHESEPSAQRTPCAVATPKDVFLDLPHRIVISDDSISNFERHNADGYGSMIIMTHYDGSVRTIIAPTADIDAKLHAVLDRFARSVVSKPIVACGLASAILMVHFAVPSGAISAAEIHPPSKRR